MLNELKNIGLSEKEAKVYLGALELGKASVQDIAKKAGVNRTTAYVIITSLEKRGLIRTLKVGKRTHFVAENPDSVLEMVKSDRRNLETKEAELKKIIPELKTLFNISPGRPKIRFYEGPEVYKKITTDILESDATEILEIYNADLITGLFSAEEIREYSKKRVEKGIRSRTIYTRSGGAFKSPLELAEERFLKQLPLTVSGDIMIYGNRVGITSLKGNIIGVIIESEEISDTVRTLFNIAWQNKAFLSQNQNDEEEDIEEGG